MFVRHFFETSRSFIDCFITYLNIFKENCFSISSIVVNVLKEVISLHVCKYLFFYINFIAKLIHNFLRSIYHFFEFLYPIRLKQEMISFDIFEMISVIEYFVHFLVFCNTHLVLCFDSYSWIIIVDIFEAVLKKWYQFVVLDWLLSITQFINWFSICLDLYVVSFITILFVKWSLPYI